MNKKLLFIGIVFGSFLLVSTTHADIMRDASSSVNTTADPVNWTHTAIGTPTAITCGIFVNDNSGDTIVSVTVGGTAMRQLQKKLQPGSGGGVYLYSLGSASQALTGSRTVSVDLSSSQLVRAVCETYVNTENKDLIDITVATTTTSGVTITSTLTTTLDNDYTFNFVVNNIGGSNETAKGGETIIFAGTNIGAFDTGPTSPPATISMATGYPAGCGVAVCAEALTVALCPPKPINYFGRVRLKGGGTVFRGNTTKIK